MLLHAWAPRGKDTLAILVVKEISRIFRFLQVSFVGPGLFSSSHGVSDILVCTDDFKNAREIISHYLRKSKKSLAVIVPCISKDDEVLITLYKTVYHPIQNKRVFVEISEMKLDSLQSSELYSFFRSPKTFEDLVINLINEPEQKPIKAEATDAALEVPTKLNEEPKLAETNTEKTLDGTKKASKTRVQNTK